MAINSITRAIRDLRTMGCRAPMYEGPGGAFFCTKCDEPVDSHGSKYAWYVGGSGSTEQDEYSELLRIMET